MHASDEGDRSRLRAFSVTTRIFGTQMRATRLCASVLAAATTGCGVHSPQHAFRGSIRNATSRRRFTFTSSSRDIRPPEAPRGSGESASGGDYGRPLWQFARFAGLLWVVDQFVVYLSMVGRTGSPASGLTGSVSQRPRSRPPSPPCPAADARALHAAHAA